jgi:hypothetical protein
MDFSTLDEKQAFKLGFAAYCAEKGMTPDDANNFVKSAIGLTDIAGAGLVGIPFGVGMLGGGALGFGAAKYDEPEINPEEIKAKQLAETYKIYTNRLKARRAYQQYRNARQAGKNTL